VRKLITRLRGSNREQRKAILSIGASFLTRIPGAVGVLWFLPLLHLGLGTDGYVDLLSSLAMATACLGLSGGFNTVGRRIIGEAYAAGKHTEEANGFASLIVTQLLVLGVALTIIVIYGWVFQAHRAVLIVTMLSAFGVFFNQFNDVRAAYNEHYVSASLQIVLQSLIYAIGFLVPATQHSVVFGAVIIQGAYWLTSLTTFALLLRKRQYLLHGRPTMIKHFLRQGTMLVMADGFLMVTLSLSVVWLQASAAATVSAWFGTVVRLFQTFLVPVVLLLFPLSGYVRILWNSKSVAQQRAFIRATCLLGIGYGLIVAIALCVASGFYVDRLLHLPTPGLVGVIPIFALFGAIIAYSSFSSIAYVVLERPSRIATWTTVMTALAVVFGAIASRLVDPLGAVSVYALTVGLALIIILIYSSGLVRWPRLGVSSDPERDTAHPVADHETTQLRA